MSRIHTTSAVVLSLCLLWFGDAPAEIIVAECGTLRTEGECYYFDGFDTGSYSIRYAPEDAQSDTVFAWGWTGTPTSCPPGLGCLQAIMLGDCATRDWGCGEISEDCGEDGCWCIRMDSGESVALVDYHQFVPGERVHLVGYTLEGWGTYCSYQYMVSPTLLEACQPPLTWPESWGRVKSMYR